MSSKTGQVHRPHDRIRVLRSRRSDHCAGDVPMLDVPWPGLLFQPRVLRRACPGPRPAAWEATRGGVRGEHYQFQRRLPREYARSDDGHPGRRRIGRRCFPGRGSLAQTPFLPSQSRASGVVSGGERSGSAANAAAGTRPPCRCLPSCPAFNIWLEPDQHASVAEVENGARHIRIPVLVDAHGVAVREAKQLRHTSSVDEIVDVDSLAHSPRLLSYADPSGRGSRILS